MAHDDAWNFSCGGAYHETVSAAAAADASVPLFREVCVRRERSIPTLCKRFALFRRNLRPPVLETHQLELSQGFKQFTGSSAARVLIAATQPAPRVSPHIDPRARAGEGSDKIVHTVNSQIGVTW